MIFRVQPKITATVVLLLGLGITASAAEEENPYAEPPPPDLCVCFHFSISDFALLHEINQLRRKGIEKQRIAP